ncbi:MAG: hypothetical protein GQ570_06825 [Helicobacteraceae bacterium]|nr:hypothetical protein [Helicobacteraceae bacterium]
MKSLLAILLICYTSLFAISFEEELLKARDGSVTAQVSVADTYFEKSKVMKAYYWYVKAARQNSSYAQNKIATMYDNGIGVSVDKKNAFYWYRRSAQAGFESSYKNVADMYENGDGVTKNSKNATFWYDKIKIEEPIKVVEIETKEIELKKVELPKEEMEVIKEVVEAVIEAEVISDDELLGLDEEDEDIEDIDEVVILDVSKVINKNNLDLKEAESMYLQALEYEKLHEDKNALLWFIKSALNGKKEANFDIGYAYINGYGAIENNFEAFAWYKRGAEEGDKKCMLSTAMMYKYGIGIKKSKTKSEVWLKRVE